MTICHLSALLHPKSIVLIGASGQAGSLGAIVLDNMPAGGFHGQVHVVNPHRVDRQGCTALFYRVFYRAHSVESLERNISSSPG